MRGRISRIAPLLSVALGLTLLAVVGVSLVAYLSPQPEQTLPSVGCYLSFYEGELVNDPSLGPAIVEAGGQRQQVEWPADWTVTPAGGDEVVVIDGAGRVVVRTGTRVYLPGGGAPDGRWETCSGAKELPETVQVLAVVATLAACAAVGVTLLYGGVRRALRAR